MSLTGTRPHSFTHVSSLDVFRSGCDRHRSTEPKTPTVQPSAMPTPVLGDTPKKHPKCNTSKIELLLAVPTIS